MTPVSLIFFSVPASCAYAPAVNKPENRPTVARSSAAFLTFICDLLGKYRAPVYQSNYFERMVVNHVRTRMLRKSRTACVNRALRPVLRPGRNRGATHTQKRTASYNA